MTALRGYREMNISLVRATALSPMFAAMEQFNINSSMLLNDAHLPQVDCCDPNDWIPSERLLHLDEMVRQKAGIPSFAVFAAEAASIGEMGEFGKQLYQSSTLNDALSRYCDNHKFYRNSAKCYLMRGQNCIWLCRQTNGHFEIGFEQLEIYALSEMIKVVRLAMGPNWWPDRLYFQSEGAPSFQDLAEEAGTELRFKQEFGGFGIPLSSLVLPLRFSDADSAYEYSTGADEEYWKPASDEFIGILRQILPSYMRDGDIKIEMIAEILDLSIRSLQRQLAQRGLCYRDLLEQVRFQMALNMLKQGDLKLIEIAIDLGYGHAASFTRAFHRWAGTSPKKFREQLVTESRGSLAH